MLLAVVLVTTVTLITRHYTRRLRRAADKLAAASARIAERQLEGGDFSSAGVRELDGAMDAMRTLKENLSVLCRPVAYGAAAGRADGRAGA